MIGAELFRQGPRPRAMSLAGLANWIFTFIVAISFESIQVWFVVVMPFRQLITMNFRW